MRDRLERIKERFEVLRETEIGGTFITAADLDWLIEQVEQLRLVIEPVLAECDRLEKEQGK